MPTRLRLTEHDSERTVEIVGQDVRIVDRNQTLRVRDDGDKRLIVDGLDEPVAGTAVVSGDTVWVSIEGAVFEFHVSTGPSRRVSADGDALTPPMSATVVRIAVTVGQAVHRGDLLIALEAMKMELPIRAPRDGAIRAVHCREGELVQPGTVLIEM